MNKWYALATALMALTIVAHVFGGGDEILHPILASDLNLYLTTMSAVIWHMATFTMVTSLGVLGFALSGRGACVSGLWLIVAQSMAFTGIFLFYGMTRIGNIADMPQWIAFGLLTLFIVMGLRAENRKGAL